MINSARVIPSVLLCAAAAIATGQRLSAADDPPTGAFFSVIPFEFDPAGTRLVASQWKGGIGCPSNGRVSFDGSTTVSYSDAGCPHGRSRGQKK